MQKWVMSQRVCVYSAWLFNRFSHETYFYCEKLRSILKNLKLLSQVRYEPRIPYIRYLDIKKDIEKLL